MALTLEQLKQITAEDGALIPIDVFRQGIPALIALIEKQHEALELVEYVLKNVWAFDREKLRERTLEPINSYENFTIEADNGNK